MANGLDLSTIASVAEVEDAGFAVHIHGPADKPLFHGTNNEKPVTITVAGKNSKTFRAVERTQRKRPIRRGKVSQESIIDDELSKVVACTLAWDGIYDNGTPVPCNPANVRALYEKATWILSQITEGMDDHENFTVSASKTSSTTSATTQS